MIFFLLFAGPFYLWCACLPACLVCPGEGIEGETAAAGRRDTLLCRERAWYRRPPPRKSCALLSLVDGVQLIISFAFNRASAASAPGVVPSGAIGKGVGRSPCCFFCLRYRVVILSPEEQA